MLNFKKFFESINLEDHVISTDQKHYLHFNKESKTFSIELSELIKILNKDWKRTPNGLLLTIYNPNTNIKVDYFCQAPQTDSEGETTHWIFKPEGTIGRDTTLIVWND